MLERLDGEGDTEEVVEGAEEVVEGAEGAVEAGG